MSNNISFPGGAWPVMLTPFTADNKVDYEGLKALTKWYIDNGCSGLFSDCQSSEMFFLTKEELQACRDGYIYVHDMSARRDTMNCCLFDVATVLKGGFEMGNIWYNEPKTLDVAFDVIGDIVLSAASQQYGGFTVPSVDLILEPYAQKSYDRYLKKYTHSLSRYPTI